MLASPGLSFLYALSSIQYQYLSPVLCSLWAG